MKDYEPEPQTADEELIDVLSAISITSLRLAKRLQAAALREQQKPHGYEYECPLRHERRTCNREALCD